MRAFTWSYFILIFFNNTASSFRINSLGSKTCIFHLIDADSGHHKPSTDFVDRLISTNQGNNQQWTTLAFEPPPAIVEQMNSTHYYREVCAIILVVEFKNCFNLVYLIFGSRLYNPRTTILFFYASNSKGRRQDPDLRFASRPMMSDIYYLYFLSPEFTKVDSADSFCSTCRQKYRYLSLDPEMTRGTVQLMQLKQVSYRQQMYSMTPKIAVTSDGTSVAYSGHKLEFLYKIREVTESKRIGPMESHVLMENIAAKFNLSVEWVPAWAASKHRYLLYSTTPIHYFASVVLNLLHWFEGREFSPPEYWLQQYLHSSPSNHFVYCMKTETRESFSLNFWTVPMDSWSWACLGLSMLLWILILKGKVLDVFAVIMRQDCYVFKTKKAIFVFIFLGIVITSGYEGIVSSLLIAPPPVCIYNSLKELIDKGYKIIGFAGSVNMLDLEVIFRHEEITSSNLTSSLVPNTLEMSDYNQSKLLSQCNVTKNFGREFFGRLKTSMKENFPNIYCHRAINSIISSKEIHTFAGPLHRKLFKTANLLRESGITAFYHDIIIYFLNYSFKRIIESDDYKSRQPTAFEFQNWKILSIFCIWGVLLTISVFVYLAEVVYRRVIVQHRQTGVITRDLDNKVWSTESIGSACVNYFANRIQRLVPERMSLIYGLSTPKSD